VVAVVELVGRGLQEIVGMDFIDAVVVALILLVFVLVDFGFVVNELVALLLLPSFRGSMGLRPSVS
jgi:hypothetical protein